MTKITEIIEELNEENGSNHKIAVLKKHKDNKLLQDILKMTYDKVAFTYGVTMKNIPVTLNNLKKIPLEDAVDALRKLDDRTYTGNAAIQYLTNILNSLDEVESQIIKCIINRDLRINMGRTNINKVFKNLIVKPPYMRCGIFSEKTSKKITYPALVQVKADGMFQAITVDSGTVTFTARSGEERELPHLESKFRNFKDGVYIGELLVHGMTSRQDSNGFINSDESKEKVYIQLWDYVTLDEYSRGKDKKNKTTYDKRFESLKENIVEDDNIKIIETHTVQNVQEALQYVSTWMNAGLEGGILKDKSNIFVDHTAPTQLKLKLEIDAEVRITGFLEGTPGTKREKTFGSITFENDEGTIKGRTSGFSDALLEDFNSRREELIGKVMTVQFNDITKARDSSTWAFSHPRFVEIREDKDTTDTIERVQEMKEMAMMVQN